jgi:Xaa-Pro dipeptidase
MLTPATLPTLQALLAEHDFDGWLLFDFRGRNPIATAVLGDWSVGTRRMYVLIPKSGVPLAIVHEIDAELWRDWPSDWGKCVWVRQQELERLLAQHAKGLRIAVDFSPRDASPYLDCVPSGVIELLSECECELRPSAELVTRFLSVWTEEECRSHERAAEMVSRVARHAMRRVAESIRVRKSITEDDVCQWIRRALAREGLIVDSGPSVCFGPNAARNHYQATADTAAAIVPGHLLLIDLWAKEPGGIYADQTWMASIGPPSDRDAQLWEVVREARDRALSLLRERVQTGGQVTGAEVDRAAYAAISSAGFESGIAGRTGHSIDRFGLHGLGPTIDGTEADDRRVLIPGVGFSVEPGIYLKGETGVRSEVNAYVTKTDVIVTPRDYQKELVVL